MGVFKRLIYSISHEKTWTWLRKENFKREKESFRKAAQNNIIRTNLIKSRIDKMQQNSKCRICGDRDETMNHIISERRKLAQAEYKTRHDWVDKVIHWEICKILKCDHAKKWYIQNSVSDLENVTHKLLLVSVVQTNYLISTRRPDPTIITKKDNNLQNYRLCCPGWPENKTERMWKKG